jgi:uncharacterized protein
LKPDISDALSRSSDGTVMSVEITTGSKSDTFPSGYNPWRKTLGCSVREDPVAGKANLAITNLIADTFGLPRTAVSVVSGGRSSQKKILISGLTPDTVLEQLLSLLPP